MVLGDPECVIAKLVSQFGLGQNLLVQLGNGARLGGIMVLNGENRHPHRRFPLLRMAEQITIALGTRSACRTNLERDFRVRTHLAFDKVLCDELTGEVFSHERCTLRRHPVRSLWESRWMR